MRTSYLCTFLFIQWLSSVKCFLSEDTLFESEILQKDLQNEIDNYLRNVRNTLGLNGNEELKKGINRRKRQSSSKNLDAQGMDVFNGFSEKYLIPGRFMNDIVLFCFPDGSSACFAATLEANERNNIFSNKMVLYKFEKNGFTVIDEVIVHNGNTLTTYFIHGYQYIVVAQYFDVNYKHINAFVNASHVFIVDQATLKFQHVQLFDDKYLSNVFLWEHENMDAVFLTSSVNSTNDSKYNTKSHIYKWLGKNFDKIDTIKTYSPKCITPFMVGSTMYIAVANFQNDEGETDINSEIFRFNLDKEKFTLHQKIRTHAAMDIKHFSFDVSPREESFLVVANHFVREPNGRINYDTYSVIYKFSEDEYFIPFQSLRIEGAIQWLPILKGTDQFLLLVASKFHGVKPYQYDGWRFVEVPLRYTRETFGPGITSMRQFYINNNNVITIANKNNDGTQFNVFSINYVRDDTLPKFYSEIKSWCTRTLEDVKDSHSKLTELMDFVETAPHVDDVMIKTSSNLVIDNGFSKIDDLTTLVPADDINRSGAENITEIINFINNTRVVLDELKHQIKIIPSAVFQETQYFSNLEFNCHPLPCDFNELNIETLNGEDLSILLNNSVNLRDDLKYHSNHIPLEFEHLAVQNPLDVKYINNHKLDALVTKQPIDLNQKLIVRGDLFIDNRDGIVVKGAINEVKISNDSILKVDGNQDLSGKTLILDTLSVNNLVAHDGFNGLPLHNGSLKERNSFQYVKKLNVNELKLQDGLISGIDLTDLLNNTLKINAPQQTIDGYYKFNVLEANGITIRGKVYQVTPQQQEKPFKQYGVRTFIKTIAMNGYSFIDAVNRDGIFYAKSDNVSGNNGSGKTYDGNNQTDGSFYTKSGNISGNSATGKTSDGNNQTDGSFYAKSGNVSGNRASGETFDGNNQTDGIFYAKSGNVSGNIGTGKTSDGDNQTNEKNDPQKSGLLHYGSSEEKNQTETVVHKKDVIYDGDVIIKGRLIIRNGKLKVSDLFVLNEFLNLTDLINNALRLDDTDINQQFIFKTPFKSESLKANEINGIKPDSWLKNGENRTVTGRKLFNGNVTFNSGVIIDGQINGIDVKELERRNYKRKSEIDEPRDTNEYNSNKTPLTKEKTKMNDDKEILINGTVIVKHNVDVDSLQIDDARYINEVNADFFVELFTNNNGTRNFDKPKIFNGNLTIDELMCNDFKEFDIRNIQGSQWCETVELEPNSKLEYLHKENISVDSLTFSGTLDGVTADEFGKWLLNEGEQVFMGEQTFNLVEAMKGINITSGLINSVNLTDILENGVRVDKPANLSGLIFDDPVEIDENIKVDGLINGIVNISDDVVLSSSDSPIYITGEKIVMNNLSADNIYNDHLNELCHFFSKSPEGKSFFVNGSVTFSEEPSIEWLNGIDVDLLNQFAWLRYNDKVINSTVVFPDVIFGKPVDLKGALNNKNIEQVNKTYLSLSSHQTVGSPMIFTDGIVFKGQLHAKKVNVGRFVDGVMIEKFASSVLLKDVDQDITGVPDFVNITILGNFETTGLINDLNLEKDILMLDSSTENINTYTVHGHTLIKNVITGELIVEPKSRAKIQNVDFENWFNTAVKSNGFYVINGHKIFKNGLSLSQSIKVDGLVNGMKFDKENVLLPYHEQVFTGNNLFDEKADVVFNELFTKNKINNLNISDLLNRLVLKNKDNKIIGSKNFWSEIYGDNIILPEYYGDVNLTKINDNLLNYDKNKAYLFEKEFELLYGIKKNIELSLSGRAFILRGWKKIQQLKENNVNLVIPLSSFEHNKIMFAAISSNLHKSYLTVHDWDEDQQSFVRSGARLNLKSTPYTISAIPSYEANSGLQPNTMFVVTKDVGTRKDNGTNIRKKVDNLELHPYTGWLLSWNLSVYQVPKYNWVIPMYYPGLLLHVHGSCYVLYDHKQGLYCKLYCRNTFKQLFNCSNTIQGSVVSDGNNSYIIMLRKNHIQKHRNHTTDVNKQYVMDVWKFNNVSVELVDNKTTIKNPYSMSAVYDSYNKHYLISVTSEMKITLYRFNNKWEIINNSSAVIEDKTSAIVKILPTKEIVLFVASSCTNPSTQIWVGGLSSPKKIPIDINGSEIKQVIPIRIPYEQDVNNRKNNYDSFIIVTDTETAVFQPVYSL